MTEEKNKPTGTAPTVGVERTPMTTGSRLDIRKWIWPTHQKASTNLQELIANQGDELSNEAGMGPSPFPFESLKSVRSDVIPIEQLREPVGNVENSSVDSKMVEFRQDARERRQKKLGELKQAA